MLYWIIRIGSPYGLYLKCWIIKNVYLIVELLSIIQDYPQPYRLYLKCWIIKNVYLIVDLIHIIQDSFLNNYNFYLISNIFLQEPLWNTEKNIFWYSNYFMVIQELRFSRKIRGSQGFSPIPPSSAAPPFPMLKSERLK